MELFGKAIFVVGWITFSILILMTLCRLGRKSLAVFPDIKSVKVKYRHKSASGYSTKSSETRKGGAKSLLDIVVTDKELWLRGMLIFACVLERFDLLHRIPFSKITKAEKTGNELIVDFKSESGEDKQVVLVTKNPDEFLKAIKN